MKKIKKGLFVFIFLCVIAIVFGNNSDNPEETSSVEAVETVAFDGEENQSLDIDSSLNAEDDPLSNAETSSEIITDTEISIDTLVQLITPTLEASFGNNCSIEYDESVPIINISVWADGIASELVNAKLTGDIGKGSSWDTVRENFLSLSSSIRNLFETVDRSDVELSISILNDTNKDNILLVIFNDLIFYDAATE